MISCSRFSDIAHRIQLPSMIIRMRCVFTSLPTRCLLKNSGALIRFLRNAEAGHSALKLRNTLPDREADESAKRRRGNGVAWYVLTFAHSSFCQLTILENTRWRELMDHASISTSSFISLACKDFQFQKNVRLVYNLPCRTKSFSGRTLLLGPLQGVTRKGSISSSGTSAYFPSRYC